MLNEPTRLGVNHPLNKSVSGNRGDNRQGEPPYSNLAKCEDSENGKNAKILEPEDLPSRLGNDGRGGDWKIGALATCHYLDSEYLH